MPLMESMLPTYTDIVSAASRLDGVARKTPVLADTPLDDRLGMKLFLKCENLQHISAFKFRGAWNTMSRLTPEQRSRGAITHSSGNHAQAVALAGKYLGIETTVVMPNNAPQIKRDGTERYASRVIAYDPTKHKREALTDEVIRETGCVLVPPFDHPHIIAGQGTAAMELINSCGPLKTLLVPCGGGGLLSGSALSACALSPGCEIIGVEPEAADDAVRSFRSGRIETVQNPQTIADGTRTESLGKITFAVIQKTVDDIVSVPEEAIIEATRLLFETTRVVVEPSGALGLAALLSGAVRVQGRVGLILSGGNIDAPVMARILRPGH